MTKPRRVPHAVSASTPSSLPSNPQTRAPLARIWSIHARLSAGERVNAVSLARELEVCTRTIKRDIDMMRDRLGLPVEWNGQSQTYYYSHPCDTLPLLRVDAQEALAFALASRLLAGQRGSTFGRVLDAVFRKIAPVLGGTVSMTLDSVQSSLSTPAADSMDAEMAHFMPLVQAIQGKIKVQIDYTKAGTARPEKRLVHPLHLAELDRQWVLVAYDPSRRAVRNFLLTRLRAVRPTGSDFEPPPDFHAPSYLRGCLGRFAGDTEYTVRLALDAHAAFYAREKPWHTSQTLADMPDGRTELTLRISHLADARILVLRWGEHVEVLAPAELRDQVRQSLAGALAHYAVQPA